VPKDAFKAMFYLFAGKPDSKAKLFRRPIQIKSEDIYDLNNMVHDKLKLHLVDQIVSTAILKYDREESIEFGIWAEFETHNWKTHYVTQELTLRWDFMIKLPAFAAPQRHTLTVRIAGEPRPGDVFKLIMSQDPDDDQDVDTRLGLCVARVDFIAHRLADELITVVENWNLALPQPEIVNGWLSGFKKRDKMIPRFVHYSLPLFFGCLIILGIGRFIPHGANVPLSSTSLVRAVQVVVGGVFILHMIVGAGKSLANKCYAATMEYGTFSPFLLTRGDEQKSKDNKRRNKKYTIRFCISTGGAILLNLIAAAISIKIWPKS
jgi:hypothetical protein